MILTDLLSPQVILLGVLVVAGYVALDWIVDSTIARKGK